MKKNQAARRHLAAVFGLIALVLSVGMMDARNALASDDEPDFLVLNPERE
jgi:hypothetical protein